MASPAGAAGARKMRRGAAWYPLNTALILWRSVTEQLHTTPRNASHNPHNCISGMSQASPPMKEGIAESLGCVNPQNSAGNSHNLTAGVVRRLLEVVWIHRIRSFFGRILHRQMAQRKAQRVVVRVVRSVSRRCEKWLAAIMGYTKASRLALYHRMNGALRLYKCCNLWVYKTAAYHR